MHDFWLQLSAAIFLGDANEALHSRVTLVCHGECQRATCALPLGYLARGENSYIGDGNEAALVSIFGRVVDLIGRFMAP
jgi:hypothetical protein